MTLKKVAILTITTLRGSLIALSSLGISFAANFNNQLEETIGIEGTANDELKIVERFQDIAIDQGGTGEIKDFVANIVTNIIIPIFIFAGVIVAIIGLYKMMASDNQEDMKIGNNYLLRGIVGIVIMVSAGYITNELIGTSGDSGIFGTIGAFNDDKPAGAIIAEEAYTRILYPFVRLIIFVALGILFIMALINAFKYIFSADEAVQKKGFLVLIYSAMGIITIVLAKAIIEIVYGKYEDVINDSVKAGGDDLGSIGSVLDNPDYTYLYTAINRVLGLATFVIVALIIYQGYLLLINPESEDNIASLKKNLVYVFIGILVIGAAYLLTSFFTIT